MARNSLVTAEPFVPTNGSMVQLKEAVQMCRGCSLYQHATQAVFGEGSPSARLLLVGEQPGNEEDLSGRPFVGPAGRLLERALQSAHIDRAQIYVTNAVKHFSFKKMGKFRLHQRPKDSEVVACLPWLREELRAVQPEVTVCLGATAARAVLGRSVKIAAELGKWIESPLNRHTLVTYHPSAVLRAPTQALREQLTNQLVIDLKRAMSVLEKHGLESQAP